MPISDRSASSGIFICYRREDAAYAAGRIYDKLRDRFGRDRIFIDVENTAAGDDFVEGINRYLQTCAVFIAVIGEHWLISADGTRRLDAPTDFVRLELATALQRPGVRIIPVLVHEKARMPDPKDLPDEVKEFSRKHAVKIDHERFKTDIAELLEKVDRAIVAARRQREIEQRLRRARQALEAGDYEAVIACCEEVLVVDPEDAGAFELLDRARSAVEAARERDETIRIALDQARKRLAEGDLDEALRHADEALTLHPGLTEGIELRTEAEAAKQERLRDLAERRRAQQQERLRVQQEQQHREAAARVAAEDAKRLDEEQAARLAAGETSRVAEAQAAEAAARAREESERTDRQDRLDREEAESARLAKAKADDEMLARVKVERERRAAQEADAVQHELEREGAGQAIQAAETSNVEPTPSRERSAKASIGALLAAEVSRLRVGWKASAVLALIAAMTAVVVWRSYRAPFVGEDILDGAMYEGEIHALAITADQKQLIAAGESGLKAWDFQTGSEVAVPPGPSTMTTDPWETSAVFDHGATLLAVADDSDQKNPSVAGGVTVWAVSSGKLGFYPDSELMTMSADGRYIAVRTRLNSPRIRPDGRADRHGAIEIYDRSIPLMLGVVRTTVSDVAALSSTGPFIAVGGAHADSRFKIEIWNATGPELGSAQSWQGYASAVTALVFSPDGRYIAAATAPNSYSISRLWSQTVRLWEVTSGRPVGIASGGSSLTFSPDGEYLASAGDDDTVKVLKVPGAESRTLRCECGTRVSSVVFSPDGRYLVASWVNRYLPPDAPPEPTRLKLWRRR